MMSKPHREVHEAIRARARAMGLSPEVIAKLRNGASVLPIYNDEIMPKRRAFTMGMITNKGLNRCIKELRALGIRQDTFWATVLDVACEFVDSTRQKHGLEPLVWDHEAMYEEYLDTITNPQYDRSIGHPRKDSGRAPRIHIDSSGRPLDLMPAPSEKAAMKAAALEKTEEKIEEPYV